MKRLPLLLNILLAVAVAVLYVLHFTGIGTGKKNKSEAGFAAGVADGSAIFYVQIDSVISKFDMATDLSAELESKYTSSEAAFQAKQEAYQKDVNDYQYKAQRGLITRSDAQTIEQQLYTKQQDLLKLQQDLTTEISEKQAVMNRQVINSIMEYLKENSAQFNYKYVLGTSFGGNILYANDSLDITENIVTGLNEKYQLDKKKE
ncbi:MAG: OmpH family outer membrane protein [Bacteroidales bacterium]|nr:OmpH family outer membrane protein [Bacteroidales bacterium]